MATYLIGALKRTAMRTWPASWYASASTNKSGNGSAIFRCLATGLPLEASRCREEHVHASPVGYGVNPGRVEAILWFGLKARCHEVTLQPLERRPSLA